jgi:hypothetical protein
MNFKPLPKLKTEREVLDEVRLVFPNAKFVRREPPLDLVARECLVCGRVYYNRSGAESQYCGNECASAGHRKHSNPSKDQVKFLRRQCRLSRQRASDRVAPETFDTWLRNFEEVLRKMPERRRITHSLGRECLTRRPLGSAREHEPSGCSEPHFTSRFCTHDLAVGVVVW